MLIDLKLEGKTIIVVGGGAEAYRKTQSFVDSGAKIWVISRDFSERHPEFGEAKKVALLKTEIKDAKAFVDSLNPKPDVLLAVTNNSKLNFELVKAAKAWGCMVYSVDNPAVERFHFAGCCTNRRCQDCGFHWWEKPCDGAGAAGAD